MSRKKRERKRHQLVDESPSLPQLSDILVAFGLPIIRSAPRDADGKAYAGAFDFIAQVWNGCVRMQNAQPGARYTIDDLICAMELDGPLPDDEMRALLQRLMDTKLRDFAEERRIVTSGRLKKTGPRIDLVVEGEFSKVSARRN